ncbi:MAG TPA: hypothetical protein VNA25_17860 [Phycisphaerae bacterium]|nr:hypothetical protein [Phycisphaerae bacterium]
MATLYEERKEYRQEEHHDSRIVLTRRYAIATGCSLADAGLKEGVVLPDDANAEILTVKAARVPAGKAKAGETIVEVKAEKFLDIDGDVIAL